MNQAKIAQLATSVMSYDYGPSRPETPVLVVAQDKTVVAKPARDPFEADFGEDPTGAGYMGSIPNAPPARQGLAYEPIPVHPGAPHQTITVKTPPPRSIFVEFAFQVLAVVAGGYVVQRFVTPRMGRPAVD